MPRSRASPAISACCTGAAPRQAGSSEKCRLIQPWRGRREQRLPHQPAVGDDDAEVGAQGGDAAAWRRRPVERPRSRGCRAARPPRRHRRRREHPLAAERRRRTRDRGDDVVRGSRRGVRGTERRRPACRRTRGGASAHSIVADPTARSTRARPEPRAPPLLWHVGVVEPHAEHRRRRGRRPATGRRRSVATRIISARSSRATGRPRRSRTARSRARVRRRRRPAPARRRRRRPAPRPSRGRPRAAGAVTLATRTAGGNRSARRVASSAARPVRLLPRREGGGECAAHADEEDRWRRARRARPRSTTSAGSPRRRAAIRAGASARRRGGARRGSRPSAMGSAPRVATTSAGSGPTRSTGARRRRG